MFNIKVLGSLSLAFFLIAILILLFVATLLVFPTLQTIFHVDAQAFFIASDALALVAAVLGFFSRQTRSGKVGEIGGVVLFIPLSLFLSFIMITSIQTQAGV